MMHKISLLTVMLVFSPVVAWADDAEQLEFFEKKIRPVLVESCYPCHSAESKTSEGKLLLDSRAGWADGGESGPAILPGNIEGSLLIQAIRRSDKDLAMPPDEALPAPVVQDFITWIQNGAIDPRQSATGTMKQESEKVRELTEREQWAFSKPVMPTLPAVREVDWVKQPIDRFILSRIEAANITHADPATVEQLARRLHFDLNGLPPTPTEIADFVADAAVDRQLAVQKLVDELLSRPAYGEKWGRVWLDCVRYTDSLDSRGSGSPGDVLDAWRYRDWVVNALNRDFPYRDFVRHQIAGDLLAAQQWNPDLVVATGMYAIGNWGNGDSDKQKVYTDIVDDQIDVTGRAFLGLTLACARCHDHKFDPISTADYYGLAGFFFSSHILEKFAHPTAGESLMRISLLSREESQRREEAQRRIADLNNQLNQQLTPLTKRRDNVAGRGELISWSGSSTDNPSMTVNRGTAPISFLTIRLPGSAVAVHPGPKETVTVVWQSPIAGSIDVTAALSDADRNGGDGVHWSLATGEKTLAAGDLINDTVQANAATTIDVTEGQLVRLSISPRDNYYCDSTQVELRIRHADSSQEWSFTEAMLRDASAQQLDQSHFVVCSGDAQQFGGDDIQIAKLTAERDQLQSLITPLNQCQGLQEGGVPGSNYEGFQDARIHIRGNYRRLAALQPRGFPTVFESHIPSFSGSGRLELAEWIASEDHPLTARVMVNRLWQHHFGRGIVATPNNFGSLGTPPTDPELLDWLAVTFMERNWSLKEMHRLICTSATYQQSSLVSSSQLEADPDNQFFSRQNRRKLSAEELRDALLTVTGQLDRTLGGVSVPDLASPRRTLYLRTIRSDRTSYQLLFDGADPTSIVEQRIDSIVAPQALWMLNQPFVLAQAKSLAATVNKMAATDRNARLNDLFQYLYGRTAKPEEMTLLGDYLKQHADSEAAWLKVCHTLLCANEFLFVD